MLIIPPDQFANQRKKKIAAGLVKSFEKTKQEAVYDDDSDAVLVSDPKGEVTRFEFDDQGFVGQITSPMGRQWRLENDERGKLKGMTMPSGMHLGLDHDDQGKLTRIARDGQSTVNLSYDDQNNLTQLAWPDGTKSGFEYEGARLIRKTDRQNREERYDYDEDGDLTALTNANGHRTAYEYSSWNRPDHALYPDGRREGYEYDDQGRVSRIFADGPEKPNVILEYEGDVSEPAEIAYADGETLTFEYDSGKTLKAENDKAVCEYEYDGEDRLTTETVNGYKVVYEYNELGQQSAMVWPDGKRVVFKYDADGRLSCVTDWNGGRNEYEYAAGDRGVTLRTSNGLTTQTRLNNIGKPLAVSTTGGSKSFSQSFTYDAEDRLSTLGDSSFGEREYGYDKESRLLQVKNEDGLGESFAYDPAGNRITCNGTQDVFNEANQIRLHGQTRINSDNRGNTTTLPGPGYTWNLTYNQRNLLTRASNISGEDVTYDYDAFGRRIGKTFKPAQGEATLTHFIWAGEHLVGEISQTGSRIRTQYFLYQPGTYTPLATWIDGKVYQYHTDHLGTPRRLTNESGKLVWEADYSTFGEAKLTINEITNPLRFPGQYHDEETGLHYNRFRYYSPELGRYLTPDPLGIVAGSNFYAYVGNNPINGHDPMGLFWKALVSAAAAVAVGVAIIALAPVVTAAVLVVGVAAAGAVGFGLHEALTQDEFCLGCIASAAVHGTLDLIGLIPFLGEPADFLNGLIYLAEGKETEALLSFAAMLPFVGWFSTGIRRFLTPIKRFLENSAKAIRKMVRKPPVFSGMLKYSRTSKTWTSSEGLIYGKGSKQGNRVKHILEHMEPKPNKKSHNVFSVRRDEVIGLLDEAWTKKGNPLPDDPGAYIIDMNRKIGTAGEQHIKMIVRPGTKEVISAYPIKM